LEFFPLRGREPGNGSKVSFTGIGVNVRQNTSTRHAFKLCCESSGNICVH
jgi:hypothetical protein